MARAYGYKAADGVKVIMMKPAKHLPSHINQACPKRRGGGMVTSHSTPNTRTHVAATGV